MIERETAERIRIIEKALLEMAKYLQKQSAGPPNYDLQKIIDWYSDQKREIRL